MFMSSSLVQGLQKRIRRSIIGLEIPKTQLILSPLKFFGDDIFITAVNLNEMLFLLVIKLQKR